MNRPIEDRLRQAYAARADEVTPDTLVRRYSSPTEPPVGEHGATVVPLRRAPRWVAPAAAAASVVGLALLGWRISSTPAPDTSPARPTVSSTVWVPPTIEPSATATAGPSRPTGSVSPTSTPPAAAPLPTGELTRSAIPWSQVAGGWSVAIWASAPPGDRPADPAAAGPSAGLYLVGPTGGRYPIGTVPADSSVADVSPDGRRALVLPRVVGNTVDEWDLTTGQPRRLTFAGLRSVWGLTYTHPRGEALLVWGSDPSGAHRVERRDRTGAVQLALPGRDIPSASPDGRYLATHDQGDNALVISGNATGAEVARFGGPDGGARCVPVRWWDPTTVLASCSANDGPGVLWLVPARGAAARLAVPAVGTDGNWQAWATGGGTLVQGQTACSVGDVRLVPSSGAPLALATPRLAGDPLVVGVVGDTVQLLYTGCQGFGDREAQAYLSYDLGTRRITRLLGPGANGGTALSVVPVRAD